MCEPVDAKVVKITFIGESRVMIYGSCVKLHDFFDCQDHEKASHKFFFSTKFLKIFFFNFIDFLVIVPVVAEEKQGHIQNQH